MTRSFLGFVALVALGSCGPRTAQPAARDAALDQPARREAVSSAAGSASAPPAAAESPPSTVKHPSASAGHPSRPGKYDVSVPSPSSELTEFLKTRLPKGGSVQ